MNTKLAKNIYEMVATETNPQRPVAGITFPHKYCWWRVEKDARSRRSGSLDDHEIMYTAPQPAAPPCSVTRMARHRLLHALGPAGQQKKGSTGHSNTHFSKCVNLKLTIQQSFAKPRWIWGSNFSGEGKDQAVWEEGEEGSFYRRGGGSPFFMVVTPSSCW
jgi:hypothetical protein